MDALALAARALAFCAGTALLSACATRPVIEGVTGQTSYRIAQAVRCEMRDAVIYMLARRVAHLDPALAASFDRDALSRGDEHAERKLFEEFLLEKYSSYGDREFTRIVDAYSKTYVAYKFTFDITSTTNTGLGVDFLSTVTRGAIKSPINVSLEGKRNSKREFTLGDRFEDLLTNLPTIRECNRLRHEHEQTRVPNGLYPIAGKLNLLEIIQNFFSLNQSANLVGNTANKIIPAQSDTLVFTTTLSGGADPKLELSALKSGTELVGAKLNLGQKRVDIHQLVLSMNLPEQGMLTTAQQRSEADRAAYDLQQQTAIEDLERQRVRDIEDENARLRRLLRGQ